MYFGAFLYRSMEPLKFRRLKSGAIKYHLLGFQVLIYLIQTNFLHFSILYFSKFHFAHNLNISQKGSVSISKLQEKFLNTTCVCCYDCFFWLLLSIHIVCICGGKKLIYICYLQLFHQFSFEMICSNRFRTHQLSRMSCQQVFGNSFAPLSQIRIIHHVLGLLIFIMGQD